MEGHTVIYFFYGCSFCALIVNIITQENILKTQKLKNLCQFFVTLIWKYIYFFFLCGKQAMSNTVIDLVMMPRGLTYRLFLLTVLSPSCLFKGINISCCNPTFFFFLLFLPFISVEGFLSVVNYKGVYRSKVTWTVKRSSRLFTLSQFTVSRKVLH